jgi:sialic acid synthase SpsE
MKIIAEIGWNHMGEVGLAEKMIKSASENGANVAKFQYWNPAYLKEGSWDTDGRREIYNKAALNEKKISELQELCNKYNCEFLISVFGTRGAKMMHSLGIESIKIPSHETTNIKLIEFCAKNFKEIYFSCGASTEEEVLSALKILKKEKCKFNLMHCVSSYPCPDEKANLSRILWLKTLHSEIGYSDHTGSTIIPAASIILGASVIEKHFTTDKDLPGRDNKFALDPSEFQQMTNKIKQVVNSMIDHGNSFLDIEQDTVENYRGRWEPHDYDE